MNISIKEIAEERLAVVPLSEGNEPLCEYEKSTLEAFSEVQLDVEGDAFPLDVFLMGGSFQRLGIFPKKGGRINQSEFKIHLKQENLELFIFRDPHEG